MTVAVCLKCGTMKLGAWTLCPRCGYTPDSLEDKAKHVMVSDHYFSQVDLEGISTRVQNGQPLHFNPQQVQDYVAALEEAKINGAKVGRSVFGFFAIAAIVIVGIIYLLSRFA